jgi:hypothetical protein
MASRIRPNFTNGSAVSRTSGRPTTPICPITYFKVSKLYDKLPTSTPATAPRAPPLITRRSGMSSSSGSVSDDVDSSRFGPRRPYEEAT